MASTGASLPATGVAADPLSANSTLPAWAVPAGKGTFQPMATGQGTEPPGWLPQAKLPQAAPPVPPASVDAAVAPVAPISPLAEPTATPPEEDVAESLPAENEKNEKDEERDGTTSTLEKGPVPDEPAAAKPAPKKRVRKSASGTAGKRPRRSSTSSPIDYAARPAHKAPPPIPANVAGKTPKPSKKTAKKTKQDSVDDEVYEVQQVISRRDKDGKFKVRWVGFGPEHDTWEPEESLKHTAAAKLAQFLKGPSKTKEPAAKRSVGAGRPSSASKSKAASPAASRKAKVNAVAPRSAIQVRTLEQAKSLASEARKLLERLENALAQLE